MAIGPLIFLWQGEATANPVIPFRYGQGILAQREAFVAPRFQRFPYFQPAAPANPVIPTRYGRDVLSATPAFIEPGYQRFPYFQQPAPANPVPPFMYGRPLAAVPETLGNSRYLPVVHYPAPTPVIPFTIGRSLVFPEPIIPSSVGRVVPFPAAQDVTTFIGYRLGQLIEPAGSFLPLARHQVFPYFQAPAPAQPPIFFTYGRPAVTFMTIPVASRFQEFPYQPQEAPPVIPGGVYIPTFRPRRGR